MQLRLPVPCLALVGALSSPLIAQNEEAQEEAGGLTADNVEEILAAVDEQEGSWVQLLADNLAQWRGDLEHYQLTEEGELEVLQGGRALRSDAEYADFVLRFEFRLTDGANNGIGVRVPPSGGNPAYAGMEIQILDDTAEKYAELEDYQYHGGLYGIQAAEHGHLRELGEWNSQLIVLDGRELRVILNGVLIQSANLDEVEPIDGDEHPGLARETGNLVLCGHGDPMTYRNLELLPLNAEEEGVDDPGEGADPPIVQADFDGDGFISAAEYEQFNAQRNLQDREIFVEQVQREEVVRTIQDVDRRVQGVENLGATLGIHELSGGRRRGETEQIEEGD